MSTIMITFEIWNLKQLILLYVKSKAFG